MSDDARAENKGRGTEPSDDGAEESWLREAVRAPHAARVPKPGDVIGGKYRIEALLGRGGMGVVFRARHMVSEKPVAIKWMLRPATDEQAQRRFEREARAVGRIDHPNVVVLYDIGEEGDCSYLVMELLRGESLRNRLSHGPIAPADAVEILIPAMRGVAAAHRAGVVHRDLKPDNIFLCQEPEGGRREAKVLDFGVSSITGMTSKDGADSTLTQEGTLLGSLAYMSPEQLSNAHDVDARADVYAFGVILYEVLTGGLPFRGASQSALAVAIVTTEPARPSQIQSNFPSGLEEVVLRALARERAERYPDMNHLIEALLPFREGTAQRSSETQAGVSHGTRSGTPTRESGALGRVSSIQLTALPVSIDDDGGGAALGRKERLASGSRVVLAAASLLAIAALWAFASHWRRTEQPVSSRPNAPAPSAQKATLAPDTNAIRPSKPALTPALPPATPSVVSKPEKLVRRRVARSTSDARSGNAPAKSKVEAKEDDLFSGRK